MKGKVSVIREDFKELVRRMDSAVLQPLECIEQDLGKNWKDMAADAFIKKLAMHRERIESVSAYLDRLGDSLPIESDR